MKLYDILSETKKNLAERSQYYLLKRGMNILQLSKRIKKAYSYTHRLVNNGNKLFVSTESIKLLVEEFGVTPEIMVSPLAENEKCELMEIKKI